MELAPDGTLSQPKLGWDAIQRFCRTKSQLYRYRCHIGGFLRIFARLEPDSLVARGSTDMGQTISSIVSDVRVLANLAMAPFRHAGESHKERLEAFYQAQAGDYDAFRKRLLQGREELMAEAKAAHGEGGIWVDLGGGTGANLEMMGDEAIMSFAKVYLVDLCGPLLEVARKRCEERGWHNVQIVEDDATTWVPEEGYGQVNLITFSYSLTMIPDWYAAIEHAAALLAPGGLIGTVDFYVARKHPAEGMAKHSWLQRTFWPTWFLMDDVRLNMDHVPYLLRVRSGRV